MTRRLIGAALRELRGPVRRTRVKQKLRRWSGARFVQLARVAKRPIHVHLGGTGFTALWETHADGPDDLDRPRPRTVTRRFTLGQVWQVHHDYDEFTASIILAVDDGGQAVLLAPNKRRYPATAEGWELMFADVAAEYGRHRGGRWQGMSD